MRIENNTMNLPILVATRSAHGFGDHQSQAARRTVSTWIGDRLANIDL